VYHDWKPAFLRDAKLFRKRAALVEPGRVVVVVIETAFTDCNCSPGDMVAKLWRVARWIETFCIVRMNAGGVPDKAAIRVSDLL
jgi:hypothetical protein